MKEMDPIKENWNLIKETLRKEYELSDISYSTWIDPLGFYEVKDNVVTILIPSDQAHALNYISSKYKSFFQVTISEMMNHTYDIAFILEKDANKDNSLNAASPNYSYNINYENANL
ncbi:MAG: DnaA N-terminal domain-containing protein, partial [Bacilli bacterium]